MAGKLIMIFIVSFIGYDLKALLTQPLRTAIVILAIVLLWFVGKKFEQRLNKKVEADFREIARLQEER